MSHVTDHLPAVGKLVGEVVALGTIAGVMMEWLPVMAALLAVVWHILRIYDWFRGRRDKT